MLEVRDEHPRRRHPLVNVSIAYESDVVAYARRESYKIIHALVRRYSLDPQRSNLRSTKVRNWEGIIPRQLVSLHAPPVV